MVSRDKLESKELCDRERANNLIVWESITDRNVKIHGKDILTFAILGRIMTISITPQLESLIKEKLATGRYHSADEVMSEALKLLELRDEQEKKLEQLRLDIQAGLDSGDPVPFDKEAIRQLARQKM